MSKNQPTMALAFQLRAVAQDRARQVLEDGFHHGVRFEPSVNRPQQEGLVQALALLQACTEMIADLQQTADAAAARAHAKGASYTEIGMVRGTSRQAARQRHHKWLAEQKARREAWQPPRQDERWPPRPLRLRAPAGQWTVTLTGGPLDSQILRVPVGDDAYPLVGYTEVFGRRQPRHARYSPAKPGDNRYQFTGEFFIGTLDGGDAAGREREGAAGASGNNTRPATTYRPGPTGGLPSSAPSPPPAPPPLQAGPGKRVHELAAELGVDSRTVLASLQSIGAFVKSASSRVDAATAHRLRHELRNPTARTGTPQSPTTGSPSHDMRPPAPLTGLAKTLRGTFPQMIQTDDEAHQLAAQWTDHRFTEEDMVAWCRHGLTPHDYATARQLESYGIRPHHLELVIEGNAVKTLLRGGRSVTWVAGLLRQGGHIHTP